jgi:hypothetical protein
MSVTSVMLHFGFGKERSGRHWLWADILRSSATNHTTAMMVTARPGPLYAGAIVIAPQKTLNARMNLVGTIARRTEASCAWRAARSCSRAPPGVTKPVDSFSILESYHMTCRSGKPTKRILPDRSGVSSHDEFAGAGWSLSADTRGEEQR